MVLRLQKTRYGLKKKNQDGLEPTVALQAERGRFHAKPHSLKFIYDQEPSRITVLEIYVDVILVTRTRFSRIESTFKSLLIPFKPSSLFTTNLGPISEVLSM